MSYTKGEWEIGQYMQGFGYPIEGVEKRVGFVFTPENAHLIAAAPNLLKVLKALALGIDAGKERLGAGRETMLREAIAEAERGK